MKSRNLTLIVRNEHPITASSLNVSIVRQSVNPIRVTHFVSHACSPQTTTDLLAQITELFSRASRGWTRICFGHVHLLRCIGENGNPDDCQQHQRSNRNDSLPM